MPNAVETKSTTLFSLARLRTYLGITDVSGSKDEELAIIGDAASEEIEQETGRVFVKRTATETYNGDGNSVLFVRRPIVSISSLTVDGNALVLNTDYKFDARLGAIYRLNGNGFTQDVQNISITYVYGYDVQDGDALPNDVYRAGLDLAKARWDEKSANAVVASTISLGPSSMVIKPGARPPSVQRIIDNWTESRV